MSKYVIEQQLKNGEWSQWPYIISKKMPVENKSEVPQSWGTLKMAEKALNSLVSIPGKVNLRIAERQEIVKKEKEEQKVTMDVSCNIGELENIKNAASTILDLVESEVDYSAIIGKYDKAISDIMHFLEYLDDVSPEQALVTARLLSKYRKERRVYKELFEFYRVMKGNASLDSLKTLTKEKKYQCRTEIGEDLFTILT